MRISDSCGRAAGIVVSLALIACTSFFFSMLFTSTRRTVALFVLLQFCSLAVWGMAVFGVHVARGDDGPFNYFFPSAVGACHHCGSRNWVALFAFLVPSFRAASLSRASHEAEEATSGCAEVERLYQFSRNCWAKAMSIPLINAIPDYIVESF